MLMLLILFAFLTGVFVGSTALLGAMLILGMHEEKESTIKFRHYDYAKSSDINILNTP